ncbi:hypothetical protein GCM10020220_054750 [Nonomuraea rubra]
MPESRTATSTPSPVLPNSHTWGAPIWAVLSARSAFTFPSSQTLAMPPERAASPLARPEEPGRRASLVSEAQNAADRSASTAAPWMLDRARTCRAPWGTAAVLERAAASV